MVSVNIAKPIQLLFRKLPHNGIEMRCAHGKFNNALQTQLPTKKYLDRLIRFHDVDFFSLNVNSGIDLDCNASFGSHLL